MQMVLRRFGINFVEYAQLADFLLAAIRDPFVVLASAIPPGAGLRFLRLARPVDLATQPGQVPRGRRKNPRMTDPRFLGGVAAVDRRRVGDRSRSSMPTSLSNAGIPPRPFPTDSVLIITVTSGYVFAYFPTNYETRVIPSDNLAYLGRRRVPQRRIPTLVPGWRAPAATPTDSTP
ncbi:MAG: hypothetical protein IPK33_10335 [Gemmatimonadetes bacterium]|nr:hypothetical protein [Gemmatimonadota bacterium]